MLDKNLSVKNRSSVYEECRKSNACVDEVDIKIIKACFYPLVIDRKRRFVQIIIIRIVVDGLNRKINVSLIDTNEIKRNIVWAGQV